MRKLLICVAVVMLLILAGCGQVSVKDLAENTDKYMGKKVIVLGDVSAPLNLGKMKGFSVRDGEKSFLVSSDIVPDHGDRVAVRGIVVRGMLTGPYIYADTVTVKETRQERELKEREENGK